jgi:hypothetical protein
MRTFTSVGRYRPDRGPSNAVAPRSRLMAQTIALTGGTVYPVSGPKIDMALSLIATGAPRRWRQRLDSR